MKPRTALALQLLDVLETAHELGFDTEVRARRGHDYAHVSLLLSEPWSSAPRGIGQSLGLHGDASPSIMGGAAGEIAVRAGVIDREALAKYPSAKEGREYLEKARAEKARFEAYAAKLDAGST